MIMCYCLTQLQTRLVEPLSVDWSSFISAKPLWTKRASFCFFILFTSAFVLCVCVCVFLCCNELLASISVLTICQIPLLVDVMCASRSFTIAGRHRVFTLPAVCEAGQLHFLILASVLSFEHM